MTIEINVENLAHVKTSVQAKISNPKRNGDSKKCKLAESVILNSVSKCVIQLLRRTGGMLGDNIPL